MRHEHLVRINDPSNTLAAWLTREQLWEGLRHTVLAPQALDESIDSATINQVSPFRLKREIRRGRSWATDEVELVPNESLQITADARTVFAGSTLTIRIEEPAPEMLFVRFTYDVCGLADVRDEEEDNARCSAYEASDIDRIGAARCYATRA